MEPEESNKSPPKDWRSGNQLHREGFAGGNQALNRSLEALRLSLIGDITAAGIDDAEAIVDHNLISLRKPVRGRSAIYGSPEAIAMLDLRKTAPSVCPPARPDWLSANKLKLTGYKGGNEVLDRKLRAFRAALLEDIIASGISSPEAEAILDHNLISLRSTKGQEAYHGSPDAIAMMEREGKIKKCDPFKEPDRGR